MGGFYLLCTVRARICTLLKLVLTEGAGKEKLRPREMEATSDTNWSNKKTRGKTQVCLNGKRVPHNELLAPDKWKESKLLCDIFCFVWTAVRALSPHHTTHHTYVDVKTSLWKRLRYSAINWFYFIDLCYPLNRLRDMLLNCFALRKKMPVRVASFSCLEMFFFTGEMYRMK